MYKHQPCLTACLVRTSINSQGHSQNYAESDCSEIDGFAERGFEELFVPDAAVENVMVQDE